MNINPKTLKLQCTYTVLSPVSHHDANLGREANLSLYNRQKIRIPIQDKLHRLEKHEVDAIQTAFLVPEECYPIFRDEPFSRFVGIALVHCFIGRYGKSQDGVWGTGLFTGVEAYRRLSDRMELAAPRSRNLKEFWSILVRDMQCGPLSDTQKLFTLLSLPSAIHHEVLYHIEKYSVMLVEMARHWLTTEKSADEKYAKQAKVEQTSGKQKQLDLYKQPAEDESISDLFVPLPCHSGNDLRHDIRSAGMMHLFATIGISPDTPMNNSTKALFQNGGNIAKGKQAPSTAYALSQIIREKYPLLGLLGGCTESFLIGDSNLHSVLPVWHGREYNEILKHIFNVTATHSVLSMMDNWTLHRHVGRYDGSPMPYSFETVATGAKMFVQFQFSPWITDLELGAFWCALRTYTDTDSTVGGQSAKGFGQVKVEIHSNNIDFAEHADAYEAYLQQNLITLAEGVQTGTLCCGQVVCS